jgi:hypothetical protein
LQHATLPNGDECHVKNQTPSLLQAGRCWAALEEYEAADAVLSKGLESGHWLQVRGLCRRLHSCCWRAKLIIACG